MTNEQIKDYLKKYRIDSEEQLVKHIEELKRNTIPNNEIIFPLVDLLLNEKSVLLSFFAENKKQELFTRTITPFFLDEVVGKCSAQCFCDGSCKKDKKLTDTLVSNRLVGVPVKFSINDAVDYAMKSLDYSQGFHEGLSYSKDDVITNSSRGEKEMMKVFENTNQLKDFSEIVGVKESQTIEKAPIFTYCKVNKNALEALSLRALYGHKRYKETDEDWQNFTRVPNALDEYANAEFRHALGIGEEDEETHLIAETWNAVAKLEVFLRNKLNKS